MESKIINFIDEISQYESQKNYTNLYFGNSIESQKRKENLELYLNLISKNNSKVLLLGEASGYKGCRNTGIAFTCEHTLKTHSFFKDSNFSTINEINYEKEYSASFVWRELSNFKNYPLIWNIFPFHPHKIDNIKSNRTPKIFELNEGVKITQKLMEIFDIEYIICIGRKSEKMIKNINIKYDYVRHPSMGGAKAFQNQINKLL
jgi:hypothetical protein